VLAAAADLDLFQHLSSVPKQAVELAKVLDCDLRGLTVLLDALVVLQKHDASFAATHKVVLSRAKRFAEIGEEIRE